MTDLSNIKIVTRKESLSRGETYYFTGEACIRGHIEPRQTSNGVCCACRRERAANTHSANRDKANAKRRDYRKANPEKTQEWSARSRAKNTDAIRLSFKKWSEQNPDNNNQRAAKRRSRVRLALPFVRPDLEPILRTETLAFYAEARTLTELTGVPHDVDHIFPISKGGLHAPWNMRVLLRHDNRVKKDKWPKHEPLYVMWHGELMCRVKDPDE